LSTSNKLQELNTSSKLQELNMFNKSQELNMSINQDIQILIEQNNNQDTKTLFKVLINLMVASTGTVPIVSELHIEIILLFSPSR
jgi:hypothetical protein